MRNQKGTRNIALACAQTILKLMGKSENLLKFVKDRPGHDFRYSLDTSKIEKHIGWKASVKFDEGTKRTSDWYIRNEWWWKPIIEKGDVDFHQSFSQ